MAKKDKNKRAQENVDQSSVAKGGTPDAESNSKLADFAKEKKAKEEKKAAAEKKAMVDKAVKRDKAGMVKLPPLPRKGAALKPLKPCGCGCGSQTRSKFYPGHDQRLKGWCMRIARELMTLDDVRKLTNNNGEGDAVAAEIKRLKKAGEWEALKKAQVQAKKAKPEADDADVDETDDAEEQDEE